MSGPQTFEAWTNNFSITNACMNHFLAGDPYLFSLVRSCYTSPTLKILISTRQDCKNVALNFHY